MAACSPPMTEMRELGHINIRRGEQAAMVLASVHRDRDKWSEKDREAFMKPIREKYEHEGHPYYASSRIWDDGIIAPTDTRRVLGLSLAMAANAPLEDSKFGVFRM